MATFWATYKKLGYSLLHHLVTQATSHHSFFATSEFVKIVQKSSRGPPSQPASRVSRTDSSTKVRKYLIRKYRVCFSGEHNRAFVMTQFKGFTSL